MTIVDRKGAARRLTDAKRLVVKVGSTLLVDAEKGRLNRAWLESFAADVAALRKRGQEVILVSSGAIAVGRGMVVTGLLGDNPRGYGGKLQDRSIRVEQMLRFQRLFPNRTEEIHRVSTPHYIALRFAEDAEASQLFDEVLRNPALTNDDVKKRITVWVADPHRV